MVLFEDNDTTLIQIVFSSFEKVDGVFVRQVRQNPLNPDAIVLLFELEILEAGAVEISGIFLFKYLFGFIDIFLALVDDVNLI